MVEITWGKVSRMKGEGVLAIGWIRLTVQIISQLHVNEWMRRRTVKQRDSVLHPGVVHEDLVVPSLRGRLGVILLEGLLSNVESFFSPLEGFLPLFDASVVVHLEVVSTAVSKCLRQDRRTILTIAIMA